MLGDNLKKLRQSRGLSQEEMAGKLNVVRQTVSKWEKGLSVPDSEMLMEIARQFEIPVSTLLGETPGLEDEASDMRIVLEKLTLINEQHRKRLALSRIVKSDSPVCFRRIVYSRQETEIGIRPAETQCVQNTFYGRRQQCFTPLYRSQEPCVGSVGLFQESIKIERP